MKNLESLSINSFTLGTECEKQPALVLEAGVAIADASLAASLSQLKLDNIRATLFCAIRKHPEKFGIDKPTEAAIDSVIENTEEFSKARRALLSAKHNEVLAEAYAKAVDRKGSMLGILVQLEAAATH